MVRALRDAVQKGELHRVQREGEVDAVLNGLMACDWVVYTKNCLHHTDSVVDYLARYTHRIAITNARILAVDDEQVTFRYKDYRDGGRHKPLRLASGEFVRRFLLHILPKGLMRVRHFGFLANRCRERKLAMIRQGLKVVRTEPKASREPSPLERQGYLCPQCHQRSMRVVAQLPSKIAASKPRHPVRRDNSARDWR